MFQLALECQCANIGLSSNCNQVAVKIPQTPFLNSEVTGLIFIKMLHNVAESTAHDLFKAA